MFVGAKLEGSGNNSIGITMIRNHYILISTVRADRKAASIISINFSGVFNSDMQFIGWCRITRSISRLRYCVAFGLRWLGIHREDTLEQLYHIFLEGFIVYGLLLGCILVGQFRPICKVARLDRF